MQAFRCLQFLVATDAVTDGYTARTCTRRCRTLGLSLGLFALCANAYAQDAFSPSNSFEHDEVETYFDGFVTAQLDALHIAGAALAIVKDGRVVLAKGYGYANVAKRQRVDGTKTLFRIGSITKLFVWTAVMQLVEQGKLDLDVDINEYTGSVRIPDTYPQKVTMRHLMTHTPGFEDRVIGLFAQHPRALLPLDTLLTRRMPARVRAPGEVTAYSNFGTALAGYALEHTMGMRWEQYVQQSILDPLQMNQTTMRQPVPAALMPYLSKAYNYTNGRYRSLPLEYVTLTPAGGASASAKDMARFMLAHLGEGRVDSVRILKAETLKKMREQLFTNDERVAGMAYGFYEMQRGSVRAIGHGGDAFGFHSLLMMIPEQQLGIFVSYNGERGPVARRGLKRAFLSRYFPETIPPLSAVPSNAETRVQKVAGRYVSTRLPHTNFTKLAALVQGIEVKPASHGRIVVRGPSLGTVWMVEQEPYLFRETLGNRKLLFKQAADGSIAFAFFEHTPTVAFTPAALKNSRRVHGLLVGSAMLVFLSAGPVGLLGLWRRRNMPSRNKRDAAAHACMITFSFLFVMFGYCVASALRQSDKIAYGVPAFLSIALWLPVLAIPFWVVAGGLTALGWKSRSEPVAWLMYQTVVLLVGGLFIGWLAYWNLLGG